MARFRLEAQSSLGPSAGRGFAGVAGDDIGVRLSLRRQLGLACVMARKGQRDQLSRTVREAFGLTLPMSPARVTAGSVAFVWAGPDHWLAVADDEDAMTFEARLRSALASCASICGQSDGRAVVRISGPKARDALAKGVPIDLHPREFGPGQAAVTIAGHIGIHLWQIDAVPTYDIAVFRSFAPALWQWLIESSEELGLAVTEHG